MTKPKEMNREIVDDVFGIIVKQPLDKVPWPPSMRNKDKVLLLNTLHDYYMTCEMYEKCKLISDRKMLMK